MTLQHPAHLVPEAQSTENMHLADPTAPNGFDPEKNGTRINATDDIHVAGKEGGQESDDASSFKQDGVKKVEAVTRSWNKKTLFLMFVL